MGAVNHLESVHNVRTKEEAKEYIARNRLRVVKDATAVGSIPQCTRLWAKKLIL